MATPPDPDTPPMSVESPSNEGLDQLTADFQNATVQARWEEVASRLSARLSQVDAHFDRMEDVLGRFDDAIEARFVALETRLVVQRARQYNSHLQSTGTKALELKSLPKYIPGHPTVDDGESTGEVLYHVGALPPPQILHHISTIERIQAIPNHAVMDSIHWFYNHPTLARQLHQSVGNRASAVVDFLTLPCGT